MSSATSPAAGNGDVGIAIVANPDLAIGFLANTVATIACGIGAVRPEIGGNTLTDRDGVSFRNSADRPAPILQADPNGMQSILNGLREIPDGAQIVIFPAFARKLHSYAEYQAAMAEKTLSEEALDGIGLIGPRKWVKSKTGSLKLLR